MLLLFIYSVSVLSNKSTKYLIFLSYNFGYFIKRYSFKYGAGRVFKNWGRKGHPSGPTCDFPNWGRNGRAGMVGPEWYRAGTSETHLKCRK